MAEKLVDVIVKFRQRGKKRINHRNCMLLLRSFFRLKKVFNYVITVFYEKNLGRSDDTKRRNNRGWPYLDKLNQFCIRCVVGVGHISTHCSYAIFSIFVIVLNNPVKNVGQIYSKFPNIVLAEDFLAKSEIKRQCWEIFLFNHFIQFVKGKFQVVTTLGIKEVSILVNKRCKLVKAKFSLVFLVINSKCSK